LPAMLPAETETAPERAVGAVSSLRIPAELIAPALLVLAATAYGALFGWLSLERYWTYQMHALDMGNMGQAAWNSVHGHLFYFTNMRLPYKIEAWNTTTRLSFHVEALFPAISLVYLAFARPESLLILQTLAIALGAIPTYFLARDVLKNRWLALVFGLAYLLYPTVEALNLYEFHPVALATPLLIAAFLFLERRQWVLFGACCLAAMGTKEEIGLIVAMFGLYAAVVLKERRIGFATAAAGVIWSLVATLVIEHHFRQTPTVTYLRSRYGYLCPSPAQSCGIQGVVHTLTHDPGSIIGVIFVWPKLGYLLRLLAPLGFMALLSPIALLLGLPTLALNLLSNDFHMYSGVGDNSAELASVVVIASILGARTLISVLRPWLSPFGASVAVAIWVLGLAGWNQYTSGFTPVGSAYQAPAGSSHQKIADTFVSMIPGDVPVSTQDQLDPHLSSRHYVYLFEDIGGGAVPQADYVLLDASAPTYPLPSYQLHEKAMNLLQSPGWGVAAANDGLILLEHGAGSSSITPAFYTYMMAGSDKGSSPLSGSAGGLDVLGYSRERADLPNHHIPNLAYTFYFRPSQPVVADLEPVVYEMMGGQLMGCVKDPLGLAWLPSSQWIPGQTYRVQMDTLETNWNVPGTAALSMELLPMSAGDPSVSCGQLWARHGRLWDVGTLDIGL
jgi:uncharacterized membrane protein